MKLYTLDEQFIKEIIWVPANPIIGFTGIAKSGTSMLEWFKDGKRHRDNDLPALINAGNCKQWFFNGKRHRLNGPAIIWDMNGAEYYYINNNSCTKEQHAFLVDVMKLKGLM